jgi:TRAP-type C4-dicarboxylate transport system permease small subunit
VVGALRRAADRVDLLARVVSVVLVLAVLAIMCAQVWFRYVLNASLQWSEELAIWTMIWLVFVGSAVLLRNWEHIFIPTAIRLLPVRVRAVVILATRGLVLAFLLVLFWYGFDVATGPTNAFSHNVGVSSAWARAALPVGAVLMIVMALARIAEDVADLMAGDYRRFEAFGAHDGPEI